MAIITQVTPSLLATVQGIANTPIEHDGNTPVRVGDEVVVGQTAGTWRIFNTLTGRVPGGIAIGHRAQGTTDPAHIYTIDPDNPAGGPNVYAWSKDPLYHSWWIRPSPDGRHIVMMRALVADVGANFEDSYTKSSVWMANANGSNFRMIIARPQDMTNPDGSTVLAHGTLFWYDNNHFLMFRGPIKTGTTSGYVLFDLEGRFKKVILAVNGVSYTDSSFAHIAQQVPVALTGSDANVKPINITTTNGSPNFTVNTGVTLTAGNTGQWIQGDGILPGVYMKFVDATHGTLAQINDLGAEITYLANAGAGTGPAILYGGLATSITTTGFLSSLDPEQMFGCIHGATPAGQEPLGEVFRFPFRQVLEAGLGGLPTSFFQVTGSSTIITAMTTSLSGGGTAVTGISPALTSSAVGKFITGPGIVAGTKVTAQTGSGCTLDTAVVNNANGASTNDPGTGAGGIYTQINFDPVPTPLGTHVLILAHQTYDSPAGGYGLRCVRADQGQSGSGQVQPKTLIGFTTTDGGTPDIPDNAGNYVSRGDLSKELQDNGTYRLMSYRYVNDSGSALAWDIAANAPYVAIWAADLDLGTMTLSNPRTVWQDNHVYGLPYQTAKVPA